MIKEKKKSRKEKEEKERWFFHVKREKGQGADTRPGQNKLISVARLALFGGRQLCSQRGAEDKMQ